MALVRQEAIAAPITVMTQNVYVGFDVEQYAADVAEDFGQLPALTTAAFAQVLATDFPARAAAIARQVEIARPALIGLQEVALYRSGEFDGFGPPHATTVEIDFLQHTLDALAARGLHYAPVVTLINSDVEFPRINGFDANNQPIPQDIRLTDRDVILARTDLPASEFQMSNVRQGSFAATNSVFGIPFPRGWTSVDVQAGDVNAGGTAFRFITTHLDNGEALQVAQGNELIAAAGPADTTLPVVLAGDFNSRADGTGTATYGNLVAAGFTDAWSAVHPGEPGYTWGHAADLLNATPQMTERIDLVLLRGGLTVASADVVGEELVDRTPSGLWPSDHAGVIVTIVPEPGAVWLAVMGLAIVRTKRRLIGKVG